ncbi:SOS response-associated peptidase [Candidatus Saccharibacteria bacterium]|nr:SOS response-associated peptidase [Candidatus Saccharibacteria bacterium]
MISRYALYDTSDLSDRFQLTEGLPKGIKPHYNFSPTVSAPIIINREGTHAVELMKWGLVAQGAKDTNSVFRYKTYNLPSEKILTRHSWERAVRESRCLVPANGFYELNGSGKKRAKYIQPKDKGLFAFAGVRSSWVDPEGTTHGMFSVITIESPESGGRMPVVIRREDEERWLDPTIRDASSLYDMLRVYPSELLEMYEVSPAVHSPKPNQPSLIERIPAE